MDQTIASAEKATRESLDAVLGDDPKKARDIIAQLSFKERALLVAWSEELNRIGREEGNRYERRERLSSPDAALENLL